MRKTLTLFFLCFLQLISAQNPYPQNYFRNPLDITLVLSGTFAELRSNHFHSGLDIKTQQKEGLKIYTAAEGYVSRIKISHYGYGKALYITHPNGYTTVYAHLKKFSPKIEAFVKKMQYEQESFTLEHFPNPEDLVVTTDEMIAYSGNTGSSGGPHLHFEIRDKQERPINPMLFGLDVKDTRKPTVLNVFAYPIGPESHVNDTNKRTKLRLIPQKDGSYKVEQIRAYGKIGFGIVSHDRQDFAANKNGVNNIQTFFNGNKSLEIDFKRFSFSETKHLNRLIDYEYFKNNKSRIQKLFIQPNNPLSLYKDADNSGYIIVEDSTASVYRVKVNDYKNNDSWITIPIEGRKSDSITPNHIEVTDHFLYADQALTLQEENVTVEIPKNTFYDDFFIDFKVNNDTLVLHKAEIPAQKSFSIQFNIDHYTGEDKDKLFIGVLSKYGNKVYYAPTTKKGNILNCITKNLGTYTLATDIESPKIKPVNFSDGKWLSKYRYLKVKISDKLSGIKNYRATINGKWILMEYDPKKNMLVHDFNDNIVTDTKNILKVIVIDNVGNSSTFETTFYRK
ncbi:peptidoglycan DD-metalloendopeptidase family protein [Pontimicrobium sp. IMCC45349]|uniref:peptidoglycan DD-metalloendopeptidase family protein n=1 Tax=Pontimicrobium sp. IMCC45349 TaxID=3391574 RepID=UPI0039A263E3